MDEREKEQNPSEEKITAFQRKQEKREKLSSLMGQYLLKGYRMLGAYCSECGVRQNESSYGVDNCIPSESQTLCLSHLQGESQFHIWHASMCYVVHYL